jgi:hypothetical protein
MAVGLVVPWALAVPAGPVASSTDWTPIVTAIVAAAAAVFGAGIASLTGWMTAGRDRRAELARREDVRRDARREVYVRFLNEERHVFSPLATGRKSAANLTPEEVQPLYEALNGVRLTGPGYVNSAAAIAIERLEAFLRAAVEANEAEATEARERCKQAIERLLDTMRQDVAPNRATEPTADEPKSR